MAASVGPSILDFIEVALSFHCLAWTCLIFIVFVSAPAESNADVDRTLSSIQNLVKYYQQDYKNLNLDGFFGLRILEGQLQLLLTEYSSGQHRHLSPDTLRQISALRETSQNLTTIAMKAVELDDAEYFKAFNPIISQPWAVIKPHRKLDPSLRWEIPQYKAKLKIMRKNFTEETSDKCMTEILSPDGQGDCVVTDFCVKLMTSRGFTGYPITHQLLWSLLVERRHKCLASVTKRMKELGVKSVDDLQLEFCTNNFYEMVAVVEVLMHGVVHTSQQDLFLEQQFVCPSIGFYEFLKKDYLNQIISWQFPSGCFGELDSFSGKDHVDQIDFTSLLEEYNGEKLKFVPEVTVKDSNSPKRFETKAYIHHAPETLQRSSVDKLKNVSKEQAKIVLTQRKSDAMVHKFDAHADPNVHNGLNVMKSVESVLPKSNQDISLSDSQNLRVSPHGDSKKDKLLFRPAKPKTSQQHAGGNHSSNVGRHLLAEKKMTGGCLSHKSGVAAGALVMYLRYLIDPGNIKWDGQHDLLLTDTRNLLQAQGELYSAEEEEEEDEEEGDEEGAAAGDTKAILDEAEEVEGKGDEEGKDEYDDDDEEEEKEMEELPREDDYKPDEPEYDPDGNPVAPKGRLLVDEVDESPIDRHKTGFVREHEKIRANKDAFDRNHLSDGMGQELNFEGIAGKDIYQQQEEEEGHFYDDDIEAERRGSVKRRPPTSKPIPPVKKVSSGTAALETMYLDGRGVASSDQPNYAALMLVSVAPMFILLFFLFKFVRKRRVHIRYHF